MRINQEWMVCNIDLGEVEGVDLALSCNGFLTLKHLLVAATLPRWTKPHIWRRHLPFPPPASANFQLDNLDPRTGYHLQVRRNDRLVKAYSPTTITKQLDTSCSRPQKSISPPKTMSELLQNTQISH